MVLLKLNVGGDMDETVVLGGKNVSASFLGKYYLRAE